MKKLLTITSLVFIVAFVFPVNLFAQDLTLTNDGKVPGKPFEVLQQQIDILQQQIDDLQNEIVPVKAFSTTTGTESDAHHTLEPGQPINLLSLDLPKGKYISTITIQAWLQPSELTNLSCGYDVSGESFIGYLFGGVVRNQVSHAHTMDMELWNDVTVTVWCEHTALSDNVEFLDINHAEWTVIAVDELDKQESNPALQDGF